MILSILIIVSYGMIPCTDPKLFKPIIKSPLCGQAAESATTICEKLKYFLKWINSFLYYRVILFLGLIDLYLFSFLILKISA